MKKETYDTTVSSLLLGTAAIAFLYAGFLLWDRTKADSEPIKPDGYEEQLVAGNSAANPVDGNGSPIAKTVPAMAAGEPAQIDPPKRPGHTLAEIREKKYLTCGVGGKIKGFSIPEGENDAADSDYSGLEALICKAIAISVFGSWENNIKWVETPIDFRFSALRDGEIDVLLRNSTWTAHRDTSLGISFGPVYYHDGQKVLAKKASGITSLFQLETQRICVMPSGSTSIVNIESVLKQKNVKDYQLVFEDKDGKAFENVEEMMDAFYRDQLCEAVTGDESTLRAMIPIVHDGQVVIFPENAFSYEPLALAVANDDSHWRNIVSYTLWATMWAEEKGVRKNNIKRAFATDTFGPLGLDENTTFNIIKKLGNYEEMYTDSLGNIIPDRGRNAPVALGNGGWNVVPPMDKPVNRTKKSYNIEFESNEGKKYANNSTVVIDGIIEDLQQLGRIALITVVGHTDKRGEEDYNDDLSLERAQKVRNDIKVALGDMNIVAIGVGESDLLDKSSTPEAHKRNRRVEITADTLATSITE